jgi:hypothetical protein
MVFYRMQRKEEQDDDAGDKGMERKTINIMMSVSCIILFSPPKKIENFE